MAADPHAKVPKHFGLLIFPEFELLDMAGPIECLNALGHIGNNTLKLTTISASAGPVSTTRDKPKQPRSLFQQSFVADVNLIEARSLDLDVLVIPGGIGASLYLPPDFKTLDSSLPDYVHFIADVFPRLQYLFTICNGASLAARAGVLDGQRATTNKMGWKMITPQGPKTHWVARARWVESGKCWTTSGVSAGIDGMMALIAKTWGEEAADQCCKVIEYKRTTDSGDDPFAEENGAEDVLPQE